MHRQLALLIHERAGAEGEIEACEVLAHHFAGAAQPSEAARFAAMAGDKALAASSLRRARTQYLTALDMLDRLPPSPAHYQAWRAVVRRLGFVCVYDPVRADLAVLNRAVVRAQAEADAPGLAYAEYWRAYLHYALGDLREAVRGFGQAEAAVAQVNDPHLVKQLRATQGQALSAAADYPGALKLLGESHPSPGSQRPTAGGEAFALACKASVLGDMGQFDESLACFGEALSCVPRQGHEVQGSVLCWRAGVLLWQGHWAEALHDAQQAHQVAHGVKSLYLFAMSRAQVAYAQWRLDGRATALRELADAAGWLVSRDKALFVSLVHGWLADALTATGSAPAARAHAAHALWRCRQRDWLGGAMAARAMALTAAGGGHVAAALRHLGRAEQVAQVRNSAHESASNAWCRTQVLLALGEPVAAQRSLDEALPAFQRLGMAWHLQQAERLLPLLR
jgi:tetratricopeptide (TPR) repeat protein